MDFVENGSVLARPPTPNSPEDTQREIIRVAAELLQDDASITLGYPYAFPTVTSR